MYDTAWHAPLSGVGHEGVELEIVIWWARRGETYCVLVATQMAMPQRPVVEDPRSARQSCLEH